MNPKTRPLIIGGVMLFLCVLGVGFGYWWGGGAGPDEAPAGAEGPVTSVTDRLGMAPGPMGGGAGSERPGDLVGAGPITPAAVGEPADSDSDDDAAVTDPRPAVFSADPEGIRGSIDSVLSELSSCYQDLLEVRPDTAGKMSVVLSVGPEEGSATSRVIAVDLLDEGLEDESMQDCVAEALHSLHFDPGSRVTITWPLNFEAN